MEALVMLDIAALAVYLTITTIGSICHRKGYLNTNPVWYIKGMAMLGIACALYLVVRHPLGCMLWFLMGSVVTAIWWIIKYRTGTSDVCED